MFIKQERPVLFDQHAWNNHSLRGAQQHLDPSIHHTVKNECFTDPAALRFQIQLQQQDRRRLKAQHRRHPQLNQVTQQSAIPCAEGLSHPRQVQGCHPHQQQYFHEQKITQINQNQAHPHQQRPIKMDDTKNFPYVLGGDHDCWQVGEIYGSDFLSDISAYSSSNNGVHQTSSGYHVSGRDPGSTHSQNTDQQLFNKGNLGSNSPQHMAWPAFHTPYTDKYSPPPFAAIDSEYPRQQSMPAIFGDPSSINYLGIHHGLPSHGWATESSVPVLGEHMLCKGQASSPETAYSNFSLSSASETMASLSMDTPVGSHGAGFSDMAMACSATISPKVLRMNTSPAPTSLSDSTHADFFPTTEGEYSSVSSFEQKCKPPVPGPVRRLNAKGRKELPDKPFSSRYTPVSSSSSSSRRASDKHPIDHRPKNLANLKPKAPHNSLPEPSSPENPTFTTQAAERFKQNEFLIQSKLAGMTYREIKLEGGFKEAESTLRGRYRTLTKPKTARVRKPEWTDKDIDLLKRAVYKLTKGADLTTTKIPWKKVAEYISKNNGSYNFGFATCAKRWEELMAHENIG